MKPILFIYFLKIEVFILCVFFDCLKETIECQIKAYSWKFNIIYILVSEMLIISVSMLEM